MGLWPVSSPCWVETGLESRCLLHCLPIAAGMSPVPGPASRGAHLDPKTLPHHRQGQSFRLLRAPQNKDGAPGTRAPLDGGSCGRNPSVCPGWW